MTALVRGVALGVAPCGPEDETYTEGDRVTWCNHWGTEFQATVTEIFDDCIEIVLDSWIGESWNYYAETWGGTRLVFAHELRPIDPDPRRTT